LKEKDALLDQIKKVEEERKVEIKILTEKVKELEEKNNQALNTLQAA
jgi:hypothetical protein